MSWFQKEILISPKKRGFHIITDEVCHQLEEMILYKVGILHLFIKHTSASLTVNENADSTVRVDMESHFNQMVPENANYYMHTMEGPDDMPAHLKSVLIGNSLSLPICNGTLNFGTWQGVYMCEHRNHSYERKIVATIYGER